MILNTLLLLATTLTGLSNESAHTAFHPAPASGDLVRKGLHPVVVLVPPLQRDRTLLSPLTAALKQAGFAVVQLDSSPSAAVTGRRIEAVRVAIADQSGIDATRVYFVGYGTGAPVTASAAVHHPKGVAGLVWFAPSERAGTVELASQLPRLPRTPTLLIGDVRKRNQLRVITTLLKLSLSEVTQIVRAGLDGDGGYLHRSPGLADQVALVLRGWAERNCDRTAPKPLTMTLRE